MVQKVPDVPLFWVSKTARRGLLAGFSPCLKNVHTHAKRREVRAGGHLPSDATVSFFTAVLIFGSSNTSSIMSALVLQWKMLPPDFHCKQVISLPRGQKGVLSRAHPSLVSLSPSKQSMCSEEAPMPICHVCGKAGTWRQHLFCPTKLGEN